MSGEEKPETIPDQETDELAESAGDTGDTGTTETETKIAELMNQCLSLRLRDLSIRDIAEKLHVSKALVGRLLRGIQVPEKNPVPSSNPGPTLEDRVAPSFQEKPFASSTDSHSLEPSPQIPQGANVDINKWAWIQKLTPKDALIYLFKENAELATRLGNPGAAGIVHNPQQTPMSLNDLLITERIEDIKDQREQRRERREEEREERRRRLNKTADDEPSLVKEVIGVLKDLALKGGGPDPLGIYRSGVSDARENFKVKSEASNEYDVKIHESEMGYRTELLKTEAEEKKWQAIGAIASPLGPALGGVAQGLFSGKSPNPPAGSQTTMLECSECGTVWGPVNTTQDKTIKSPSCGKEVLGETFARPDVLQFKCPKCQVEIGVPYAQLPSKENQATVVCPKCGALTKLEAGESEAEPTPPRPTEDDIRPKFDLRLKSRYT